MRCKMEKIDYGELAFVTLGYICFAWVYYKLAKKWVKKVNDKYWMMLRAYICTAPVIPAGMLAIKILEWLYGIIFGG